MHLYIFFALSGLILGSFLNVCIVRMPAGESVVWPRSHCRVCGETIAARDNIPILSWLLLKRFCRVCGEPISWVYPAVEASTCLLFVLCALRWGFGVEAAGWAVLCFLLLGLAVMDARTLLLPDLFTLPGVGLGIVFSARHGVHAALVSMLTAAAAAGVLLLIAGSYWLARRRMGMGFGDVKLLAMLGSWLGASQTALVLFLGVIVGAVYGIGLVLLRRHVEEDEYEEQVPAGKVPIPFGTMLAAAGIYSIFLGEWTLRWYAHFFR
jgi:leader peptidase (prepilin peptidase) / N-methyltransferase